MKPGAWKKDRCQIWVRVELPIWEPGLDLSWYEGIGPKYEVLAGQKLSEFDELRDWVLLWVKTHCNLLNGTLQFQF